MVCNYKSTLSNHWNEKNYTSYHAYSPEALQNVVGMVQSGKITLFKANKTFIITKSTIYLYVKGEKKQKTAGHPTLFSSMVELVFVSFLDLVGTWGFPFDEPDIRYLAKSYLDHKPIEMPKLNENLPGRD